MPASDSAKFVLLTDTCCDLSRAYLDEHEVGVLHFTYTESGKPDGGLHGVDDLFESRSAHEFYDAIRAGAQPMTSQPSPAEFEEVFRAALATGKPVVYLAFSSGLSGCYEGALSVQARLRDELGADIPLYVVDTRMASTTQALYIVEAIRQRDAGLTAKQMVAWAEDATNHIHVMFMVDDLNALARGGRIPAGAAKIGALLNVKPLLSLDAEGKLTMAGVARGRKKAVHRLADLYKKKHSPAGASGAAAMASGAAAVPGVATAFSNTVTIGNADCPEDVPGLVDLLHAVDPDAEVVVTSIGPTIGCHVGPGMMAICFWGEGRDADGSVGGDKVD